MLHSVHRRRGAQSLLAVLLAILALAGLGSPATAPGPGNPQGNPVDQSIDIARDWRFNTDPGDVGLRQGWSAPGFDDAAWQRLDPGRPWEAQGFPNYDGLAWYRKAVKIPVSWRGFPLYLWLPGIDDEGDVFVNGVLLGHFGDQNTQKSVHRDQLPVDIGRAVRAGETAVVVVRVNDWGGNGGLKENLPVAIATSGVAIYTNDRFVKYWYDREPGAPWPYWLQENKGAIQSTGAAWTVVGTEGGTSKTLIGLDSSIMPNQESLAITPLLFDQAARKLYVPQPPGGGPQAASFSLADGRLPLPTARWTAGEIAITSTLFVADVASSSPIKSTGARPADDTQVAFYSVTLANQSARQREATLFLALRPLSVAGRLTRLEGLSRSESAVLANGGVAIVPDRPPDGFGAMSSAGGDVGLWLRNGDLPPDRAATDSRGLASGALAYRLGLAPGAQVTLGFKLPVVAKPDGRWIDRLAAVDAAGERQRVMEAWRARLGVVKLALPDARYADAYYASLANLSMAANGDLLLPGPLAHRYFWYRDAAYLSLALIRAGRLDLVRPLLNKAIAGQLPSGEFPPILQPDGSPTPGGKREWDSQGEGIFALVNFYRYTGDTAWLRQVYPAIRSAARFLRTLRAASTVPALQGKPEFGILPASESAEDLGPATWHHYWDDYWALTGLREAAFAAAELGEVDDAGRLREEERGLRGALEDSIAMVQRQKGIDYVPNGPEDTDSSAMARGTTPAIWPDASFSYGDPLLRRSFEWYYEHMIAPYGGAYRHEGLNYWPYGGLQLAHVYLLLGMPEKLQPILDWTLAHETFPGLYAWAESVLPSTNRFAGGDMPHAWAAAEYSLLVRDMLVREDGDRLVLAGYLPPGWLSDGERVAAAGLPTLFGPAGFELVSYAAAGYWDLHVEPGAAPPGGYDWPLPKGFTVQRVEVDGKPAQDAVGGVVHLPPGTRAARVYGKAAENPPRVP